MEATLLYSGGMRRKVFEVTEAGRAEAVLAAAAVGNLAFVRGDGELRVAPLNFVFFEGAIFVHGATAGEKFEALKEGPKVAFSADLPYSFIPSYWSSPTMACPASQYFRSVHIRGRAEIVDDPVLMARALTALMEKYQPEGKYDAIEHAHSAYADELRATALIRIAIEEMTMKEKLGQNLSPERRQALIDKLEERGQPVDLATASEIRKMLS